MYLITYPTHFSLMDTIVLEIYLKEKKKKKKEEEEEEEEEEAASRVRLYAYAQDHMYDMGKWVP